MNLTLNKTCKNKLNLLFYYIVKTMQNSDNDTFTQAVIKIQRYWRSKYPPKKERYWTWFPF